MTFRSNDICDLGKESALDTEIARDYSAQFEIIFSKIPYKRAILVAPIGPSIH